MARYDLHVKLCFLNITVYYDMTPCILLDMDVSKKRAAPISLFVCT